MARCDMAICTLALLACACAVPRNAPRQDDLVSWRLTDHPIVPKTTCEKAVLADAPRLGAKIDALAARVEQPPASASDRGALAKELRTLVFDDLLTLRANRKSRPEVLRAIRTTANQLDDGHPLATDTASTMHRLAREVTAEVPRHEGYLKGRCWPFTKRAPRQRPETPAEVTERGVAAARVVGPVVSRAMECRELASTIPAWPWHPPEAPVKARLEACHDEVQRAGHQCQVEVAPALDTSDAMFSYAGAAHVREWLELTNARFTAVESELIAAQLGPFLDAFAAPLKAFPVYATVQQEVASLSTQASDEERGRALERVRRGIELLADPCLLFLSANGVLHCRLSMCHPPHTLD